MVETLVEDLFRITSRWRALHWTPTRGSPHVRLRVGGAVVGLGVDTVIAFVGLRVGSIVVVVLVGFGADAVAVVVLWRT